MEQFPLLPLVLVLAINVISFFAFDRVGDLVGANTGSDGYKEIAENIVRGNGFVYAPGRPSTMMFGYMKREPLYPLFLSGALAATGTLNSAALGFFKRYYALLLLAVSAGYQSV